MQEKHQSTEDVSVPATPTPSTKDLARKIAIALTFVGMLVLLYFEVCKPVLSEDATLQRLYTMTITRGVGAVVFYAILAFLGYGVLNPLRRPFGKALLFCIPAALVVVNNMPILSMIWGDAYFVHGEPWYILWFALECLAIGLFEEAAFRGVALLIIAEKKRTTKKGLFMSIVLSSAVFGIVHLANLLAGASPGAVFLQIGYSFLIGAMCSVILFKTANLWLCVILHAVYDFCGHLMPTLGAGHWWDTPTVIFTTVLAIATTVFYVIAFVRMDPRETERIYSQETKH
ncbi:MAG: CPBP family intramembrane metalloprotease [Ruminococcaceae bacterium]|nr:CPBP family intramembrane metalloprotease [Oscillospiraceae bacterium]